MVSTPDPGKEVEIEDRDGYLEVRFLGTFSLPRFKHQQGLAARACRERNLARMFIDLSRLDARPTTLDRYELASDAVRAASNLKVALWVPSTFLDRHKFGILVAQNRGLTVDAFTDREKAVAWLLDPATDAPPSDRDASPS